MNAIKFLFYTCILFYISLSCSGNEELFYNINLSVYPSNGGTVTGNTFLKKGESTTITASPRPGFIFDHWRIAESSEVFSEKEVYTFQVNNNLNLIAVFKNINENSLINIAEQVEVEIIPNYGINIPKDKLLIATRYIGDDFINNGISIDRSGVINEKGNISMVINTKELESKGLYTPIIGGGPHIWLYKHFDSDISPWSKDNQYLSLSVQAAVPYVELIDPLGNVSDYNFTADQAPVTQLSFGLYFRDRIKEITFAYIIPMYESRGSYQETANANDTFTSFVSTPIESQSTYITKVPISASLQSKPYKEKKYFEVHLTKHNIEKVIRDSKENLSTDISMYELTLAGILFELPNYVKNGHNISIVNISDFNVNINTKVY